MDQNTPSLVIGQGELRGVILPRQPDENAARTRVRLDNGAEYLIPSEWLRPQADGSFAMEGDVQALEPYRLNRSEGGATEEERIPVVEERLQVGKRRIRSGKVTVRKTVKTRTETVSQPVIKETVKVERVKMNQVLEAPAQVRQEGEVLIVPVMEEVLVVQKRLVLREELHITRQRQETPFERQYTLRTEEAEVSHESLPPSEEKNEAA